MRMQQEVQVKENRWAEETSQRWRRLKGEDRTSSTEKPRKDGNLQLTQQELLMKGQVMRIASIRREESLLQPTATWEQLWAQKKGIDSIPGNEGRIAQALGKCKRRFARLLGVFLALG